MLISVVIPCYRSVKTLPAVVNEIREEFAKRPEHDYQLVLVNDGSPDDTYGVIRDLCREDDKIVGINLSRNFGQASARMAALPYIQGDCAVYMDDDGQHPASGIFLLVEKLCEGFDVVYAAFPHKKHSMFKRVTSDMQKRIGEWAGTSPTGIRVSPFFVINRLMVEGLKKYQNPFPGIVSYLLRISTRHANVAIEHRARIAGRSGYNLMKLVRLWLNTITTFSIIPLRVSSVLGMLIGAGGLLTMVFLVIHKILNPSVVMGYTSLISVVLIIGGIIMMMLGIIGEYLGRMYMTISDLPQYYIRETMNVEVLHGKDCRVSSDL